MNKIKSLMMVTTILCGMGGAAAADAQDIVIAPDTSSESGDTGEDLTVTGSRIRQRNLESVSPVTQIGAELFQERGALRVEDLLNRLPQVQAAQGGNTSLRGITGTSQIDLRGLGATRTLVLLNGRRLPYGTPKSVPADLNQIPSALIENVEVLTGGASAVYGSDAIAGVVNFTLKDDFQGLKIGATVSAFQHNNDSKLFERITAPFEAANPGQYELPDSNVLDGFSQEYNVVAGANIAENRGNVTAYGSYRRIAQVRQSERDFSTCKLGPATGGLDFTCAPSPVGIPGAITNTGAAGLPSGGFRVFENQFLARNALLDRYNDQQFSQFQRPETRYSFGALAHYEINEHLIPFAEVSFTQTSTASDYSPGAVQRNGIDPALGGFNCDNPFLSAQQANYMCTSRGLSTAGNYDPVTGAYLGPQSVATGLVINRRTPETGNRYDSYRLTNFRMVGGLRGKAIGPFDYEFAFSYANVSLNRMQTGLPSQARASKALNAVIDRRVKADGTPFASTFGQPVCAVNADGSSFNDIAACAPLDYFSTAGPSAAANDYIYATMVATGNTAQTNATFSMNGNLGEYGIQSPFANTGVGIAFGAEYRKNTLKVTPDIEFQEQLEDFPVSGQTSVSELFFEANVPLVEERPFFELLSFEGAYRYSKYKGGIETDTYKLGGAWSPVRSLRLRGSFQRAVRAPNVIELYSAQLRQQILQIPINANGTFDPCSGATPFATFAQCANTGVTQAQYGNISDNNFFGVVTGGNPNLQPETADTYSFGAVIQPSFIPSLTVSIDYFDIKVENLISTVNPTLSLSSCLQTGDPFFCSQIHRGQGGTLHATDDAFFSRTNFNTGSLKTSGIDVAINYRLPLDTILKSDLGSVTFDLTGTYLDKYTTKPLPSSTAADTYDCAGYYAFLCGAPHPEWRHLFRTSWETPWDFSLAIAWRYIGPVDISRKSSQTALKGSYSEVDGRLNARSYFDLSGTWRAKSNIVVRAGVNNVLDKDPPVTSQVAGEFGGNGNTYPQYYDSLGRNLFLGVNLEF